MARRAAAKPPTRPPETILRAVEGPEFRQERSRRSYEALVEAATALFARDGYNAVGTPEIANRAGVSVGTFYRYFDDKHEVYLELMRRNLSTAYAKILERLTPALFVAKTRQQTIAETVRIFFDHVLEQPELTRSFMEMSLRFPDVAELRRAFDQLSVKRLGELVTAITSRSSVPDPEAFAYVLYGSATQCAYGLAVHLVPVSIDRERSQRALALFIERALFPSDV